MQVGAMNHPQRDPVEEIVWMAQAGLDFVDLTLEPPRARSSNVDVTLIRTVLRDTHLDAVGHTAWYLPIASPFAELRDAALAEMLRCFDVFADLGISRVNVHPNARLPMHDGETLVRRNVEALAYLVKQAAERDLRLMLENLPGTFNRPTELRRILDAVPDLGFHLDIGHANLQTPTNLTDDLLIACGERLLHVHVSDNFGGEADLHLPLGAGHINWEWAVGALRRARYDGTITLEVFSPDRDYLLLSRDKLRRLWNSA